MMISCENPVKVRGGSPLPRGSAGARDFLCVLSKARGGPFDGRSHAGVHGRARISLWEALGRQAPWDGVEAQGRQPPHA
jgi:hypothetical protein